MVINVCPLWMQVGWELAKVVDTLKACGHRVTLILKVGPYHYQNGCSKPDKEEQADGDGEGDVVEEGEERERDQGREEDESINDGADEEIFVSRDSSRDSSCDIQSHQLSDHSANNELEGSKSPQTPDSFEGDTDFSGMQPLDLKRTTSAPLTERERASALEASTESTADSLNAGSSCEEVDGSPVMRKGDMSFEERLQNRSSGDGRLRQSVAVSDCNG